MPENYALDLTLDKINMVFGGQVVISGRKAGRPAERLTFHQKDLKIKSAKIIKHDKKGEQEIAVSRINNHKSFDEVRLHSEAMIYPGNYTVTLEFSGQITRDMNGIYPCPFKHNGKHKMLLATQLESHYARQAFPCIDEPEAKATFDLTLTTPKGETVLSNTPIEKEQAVDSLEFLVDRKPKLQTTNYKLTTFQTTPRMSTYLLAFVVGEMHHRTSKTKNGTEVNVWATVAQPTDALDFAVDTAKRSIEFFEDYFNVAYPLAKSDHVALPDFAVGAMENWGLITYRERVLLAYPDETSQSTYESIALVIAHETSHQWFGDLVTMRWWNDLWLNESFANMMEYQAVDAMFPQWQVWDTFINHEGLSALRRDATPGVQAVKTAVNHPDEISTLFDPSIVYAKGGRLLYMLKNFIGEAAFKKGLTNYFARHAYKNTSGDDLWAALSETSKTDIAAFMNPWLERSGFPLISITQNGKNVSLKQEQFLDNPKKSDHDRLWPVPLFTQSSGQPDIFSSPAKELKLEDAKTMVLNSGSKGHYLVRYATDEQKKSVVDMVASQQFNAADRLMLLNGGSMMARAGYEPYGNILTMLGAYKNENSQPVWDMISLIIGETKRFIDLGEKLESAIKALARKLIANEFKRLGWQEKSDESAADQKLRATIIALGTYAEDPEIIAKAKSLFEDYKMDSKAMPAELRSIVFGVAVKQKVPNAFEYLIKLHDKSDNSELKSDISAALTLTHSETQAKVLLGRIKDTKIIKPQDADHWLVYLLVNRYTREIAWDWLVANWSWVEQTYRQEATYDSWPRYAAAICNTKDWAAKYKKFFEPKTNQLALKRNILIGLEEIDNRVSWLNRDLESVKKFFKS